jgi:hypothetical protein
MKTLLTIAACASLAVCGCSKDKSPTSPTSTTTTATAAAAPDPSPFLFGGTLEPHGTRFYSYSLTTAGSVSAMLASVERNGLPVTNALEIGLGIPAGTGCAVSVTQNSASLLIPQLRQDFGSGTYCVRVTDVDGLPAAMNFTVRVHHP